MQANQNNLFGVPLFQFELPEFSQHQSGLTEHFLALREIDCGEKRSNQGGWHSAGDLHKSEQSDVRWLMRILMDVSGKRIARAAKLPKGTQLGLSTCWANINESGDWNAPHEHFPSDWSGVCYIRANEGDPDKRKNRRDGHILLFNPLVLGPQYRRSPTTSIAPQSGSVVLFPSYLVHMVAPHFQEEPRISVAFNISVLPSKTVAPATSD